MIKDGDIIIFKSPNKNYEWLVKVGNTREKVQTFKELYSHTTPFTQRETIRINNKRFNKQKGFIYKGTILNKHQIQFGDPKPYTYKKLTTNQKAKILADLI